MIGSVTVAQTTSALSFDFLPLATLRRTRGNVHLPGTIPSIDEDVGSRGVRASVADQVHVRPLEFFCVTVPAQGDHALPQVLNLWVHEVAQTRIDVPWADTVHSCKVAPFVGQ